MNALDVDAVVATADLVGRAGATNFEIGYLNEPGEPSYADRGAEWWCKAQYEGRRLTVEGFARPDDAATALAVKLLRGAKCRCGRLVRLAGMDGAYAYSDVEMADGTRWTAEEAAAAGQCEWSRYGQRWEPSCDAPPVRMNRAQRRKR